MSDYSIRPLAEGDLRLVLDWRNSERVHSKMLTDHKIKWEEHKAWFERMKDNPVKRNLIFEYQGKPIGYIGYTEYDEENKSCSPGAYLGETDTAPDASIVLFVTAIDYAFKKLGMVHLETDVFRSNSHVLKADIMLGYREIVGRDTVFMKDGRKETAVRLELDKASWDKSPMAIFSVLADR